MEGTLLVDIKKLDVENREKPQMAGEPTKPSTKRNSGHSKFSSFLSRGSGKPFFVTFDGDYLYMRREEMVLRCFQSLC